MAGYNGWTNHATWCVALWLNNEEGSHIHWRDAAQEAADDTEGQASGFTPQELAQMALADRLKDELNEDCEAFLGDNAGTLWGDLLASYLSDTDWHELAGSFLEDVTYPEPVATE